jgi:biopolymer transport protein ExbD
MAKKKEVDDPNKSAGATFNMTPMIDVTFQLIIVFLCSMKFRTLDQKIQAFLPKDVGLNNAPASAEVVTTVSVRLRRKAGDSDTGVFVLDAKLGTASASGIWGALTNRLKEFKSKDEKVKGEIDAAADVPHEDVMHALDSFVASGLTNVVFKGTQLNKTGTFQKQPPKR